MIRYLSVMWNVGLFIVGEEMEIIGMIFVYFYVSCSSKGHLLDDVFSLLREIVTVSSM